MALEWSSQVVWGMEIRSGPISSPQSAKLIVTSDPGHHFWKQCQESVVQEAWKSDNKYLKAQKDFESNILREGQNCLNANIHMKMYVR